MGTCANLNIGQGSPTLLNLRTFKKREKIVGTTIKLLPKRLPEKILPVT